MNNWSKLTAETLHIWSTVNRHKQWMNCDFLQHVWIIQRGGLFITCSTHCIEATELHANTGCSIHYSDSYGMTFCFDLPERGEVFMHHKNVTVRIIRKIHYWSHVYSVHANGIILLSSHSGFDIIYPKIDSNINPCMPLTDLLVKELLLFSKVNFWGIWFKTKYY
jgi:hypothetical protein